MADPKVLEDGRTIRAEYRDFPNPPTNIFVTSPYISGNLDVVWDNPSILFENSSFEIVGCNVYRSADSLNGPYTKLNSAPIEVLFYRDFTKEELIEEDISNSFISFGTNEQGDFIFKTAKKPIVLKTKGGIAHRTAAGFGGAATNDVSAVTVLINNKEARIRSIDGLSGEVRLVTSPFFDTATQKLIQPVVPVAGDTMTAKYYTVSSLLLTALHQRLYYKVTSVAKDGKETPLNRVEAKIVQQTNSYNYIWREAIRRNKWLLEQGGEKVLLFVKKRMGESCLARDQESVATHKRHVKDCKRCLGTGIVGGYEGPYEIDIAPPESAKNIDLSARGLHLKWLISTWSGPSPMIQQRDIVMRKDGVRMRVGPVTYIYDSGTILQQEFDLEAIDESDIAYRIPVNVSYIGEKAAIGSAYVAEKPAKEDPNEQKGRKVSFRNITY